jgi:hypothetical protein
VRAVNLIPLDQRGGAGPAAGASQGGAYAVPVLLAGAVILTLIYGTASHEISKYRAQVASLAVATQRAEANASQLTPYANFLKVREERQQAISTLAESRFDWAYAFQELGRVLPSDASILSLTGTVGSPGTTASAPGGAKGPAVSATPPGSVPTFALAGCATSQTEVAQTLDRLRLIDGVSQVSLQSSTKPTSGGAGGSTTCPGTDPTFSLTVTFEPLPTPSSATTPKTSTGAAG